MQGESQSEIHEDSRGHDRQASRCRDAASGRHLCRDHCGPGRRQRSRDAARALSGAAAATRRRAGRRSAHPDRRRPAHAARRRGRPDARRVGGGATDGPPLRLLRCGRRYRHDDLGHRSAALCATLRRRLFRPALPARAGGATAPSRHGARHLHAVLRCRYRARPGHRGGVALDRRVARPGAAQREARAREFACLGDERAAVASRRGARRGGADAGLHEDAPAAAARRDGCSTTTRAR